MSRTFHHFRTWGLSEAKMAKGELSPYYWDNFYAHDRAPKWFRRLYKHKKRRSDLKRCLSRQLDDIEADIIYPLSKKPVCYYW